MVFLMGYMGSGKSTLAKAISNVTDIPFYDLDDLIVKDTDISISDFFKKHGEIAFRKKETEVLKALIESNERCVVALGGGTPCYANNLSLIKDSNSVTSVYLKLSLDALVNRLWGNKINRPLISHIESKQELNDFVRKHLFERSFYYNQADVILGCDAKTESELTKEISTELF
ncbi:shikimate kinase [Croceibacter atlanticus]|mgnify:FL=1|jgi:shikimate kinase|nr:shikimate kinase [Croceibacter atlanticus]MBW4971612.1 shikimate kinase [Croceibacter atlanticus]